MEKPSADAPYRPASGCQAGSDRPLHLSSGERRVRTGERFLDCAEISYKTLAVEPLIGAPLASRRVELVGLRKWRVKDFDAYMIFYLPRPNGVLIVRVLHASRDWWGLLGLDT